MTTSVAEPFLVASRIALFLRFHFLSSALTGCSLEWAPVLHASPPLFLFQGFPSFRPVIVSLVSASASSFSPLLVLSLFAYALTVWLLARYVFLPKQCGNFPCLLPSFRPVFSTVRPYLPPPRAAFDYPRSLFLVLPPRVRGSVLARVCRRTPHHSPRAASLVWTAEAHKISLNEVLWLEIGFWS